MSDKKKKTPKDYASDAAERLKKLRNGSSRAKTVKQKLQEKAEKEKKK